jgi:transposase
MLTFKNYIGVDISKTWLDFAIIRLKQPTEFLTYRIDNTVNGLRELKRQLRSEKILLNKETLVVMEHTGIYKRTLLDFLITQRCKICVEVALRIKKSFGIQRGKSDRIDAKRIAKYAMDKAQELKIWNEPRKSLLVLKDLLSNRERIVRLKNSAEVPLNEMAPYYPKADMKFLMSLNQSCISGINESLLAIDEAIKKLVKADEKINSQLKLITSVRGIGPITAYYLICDTHEFTLFEKASQLACYAGIAPFEYQSGSSINGKKRVHPIANKKLKSLLHTGAVSAIRGKNEIRAYYDRKVAEGKPKMSVLNAIRNKLVKRVVAVVKRNSPYVAR